MAVRSSLEVLSLGLLGFKANAWLLSAVIKG